MTSFVHVEQPATHAGVARAEAAFGAARELGRRFDSTRGLAAMLLAAILAALLVVADQVIDTWANGHLLMAWVVLWAVGFVVLALCADTARSLAQRMVVGLNAWSRRVAQSRADARLWEIARTDPRVMADLQAALSRSTDEADQATAAAFNTRLARQNALKPVLPGVAMSVAGDTVSRSASRPYFPYYY